MDNTKTISEKETNNISESFVRAKVLELATKLPPINLLNVDQFHLYLDYRGQDLNENF